MLNTSTLNADGQKPSAPPPPGYARFALVYRPRRHDRPGGSPVGSPVARRSVQTGLDTAGVFATTRLRPGTLGAGSEPPRRVLFPPCGLYRPKSAALWRA